MYFFFFGISDFQAFGIWKTAKYMTKNARMKKRINMKIFLSVISAMPKNAGMAGTAVMVIKSKKSDKISHQIFFKDRLRKPRIHHIMQD